jgi:murein DD-endopeptidase MepM/ murein hydrolase activator NlpD
MVRLSGSVIALAAVLVGLASQAGAEPGTRPIAPTRALAYGVKVLLPNQPPIVAGHVEASSNAVMSPALFSYPEDGSIVRVGSVAGRTSATAMTARARSDIRSVSLFGGEITVEALVAGTQASVSTGVAEGSFEPSSITGLVVLGQSVAAAPDSRVQLGEWGHLMLLQERSIAPGESAHRGWVTALDVTLDADHAGLPIGTRILVGYAESSAIRRAPVTTPPAEHPATAPKLPSKPVVEQEPEAASPPPTSRPAPTRPRIRRGLGYPVDVPRPGTLGLPMIVLAAPPVIKRLTADGYVFPVYGPSGFGDTFSAPRAEVGWHHGADIFAPLGAPVLAVADGTLFSVGRNRLGGNRLWLRDRYGNEFYYAHLSAYSPLAVNGARVAAGDVVGFVGNTGDADTTPYHLHFEIHPASLLFLGYDGVVNPTPYLRAWERAEDVDFPSAAVWVPTLVATGRAPRPGAFLLQASDISTASGLEPGSLAEALAPTPSTGEGAIASEPSRRVPTRP